jgi:hypothetical protein
MKKLLVLAAAGAMLLSVTGVVFARRGPDPVTTNQNNTGTLTVVGSVAVSNSGLNLQTGGGKKIMTTGDSLAVSDVLSVANQNGIGSGSGNINQTNSRTGTLVLSGALSNSGLNKQDGTGSRSVKVMHTGAAQSSSSVASWANINLDGVSLE